MDYYRLRNRSAEFFAGDGFFDVAFLSKIEDENRNFVVHAKGKGAVVEDLDLAVFDGFGKAEAFEFFGILEFLGIAVVDAVDFGGFENYLTIGFEGS